MKELFEKQLKEIRSEQHNLTQSMIILNQLERLTIEMIEGFEKNKHVDEFFKNIGEKASEAANEKSLDKKTVYAVSRLLPDSFEMIGVFSSKDAAEQYIKKHIDQCDEPCNGGYSVCSYDVDEELEESE